MANIDRLVNVQIALNTTGISSNGFNTLMIVSAHEHAAPAYVLTITDADQLLDLGWNADDAVYKAALQAFSQIPHYERIKIGRMNTDSSVADNMAKICAVDNDWFGLCYVERTSAKIMEMAEWAEAHTKLYGTSVAEPDALQTGVATDTGSKLKEKNYFNTFIFYHKESEKEFPEAALMSSCFTVYPGGETWANKKLSGITNDNLTETEYLALTAKNYNTFENFSDGVSITQNGKTCAGEWIDVIRFRAWLIETIKTEEFAMLINREKLPYTDAGIALVEGVLNKVLKLGQDRGGIAPTEYDDDGNRNLGYTISVPKAANISANKKAQRVLDDVKFTARLAGAIHAVNIKGSLTYENLIQKA